jgi:hypothetical protein
MFTLLVVPGVVWSMPTEPITADPAIIEHSEGTLPPLNAGVLVLIAASVVSVDAPAGKGKDAALTGCVSAGFVRVLKATSKLSVLAFMSDKIVCCSDESVTGALFALVACPLGLLGV